MVKTLIASVSFPLSTLLLQALLQYLRSFLLLYLPFLPAVASDLFTVVAVALASAAGDGAPFKAAIAALELLLRRTVQDGLGSVDFAVWRELAAALLAFAESFHVPGRLARLEELPAKQWKDYTRAVVGGMLQIGVGKSYASHAGR